ncbi:TRAP transporter small permease [Pseudooceanicola sp.]|jgi:TRAP-type C4-dicarboxylate transport system permease small subunit|uniref:TRAP transporter small permease n=1 Tax=Pseudooceanicola sp. TaxID=1914328 RepID=UPI00405851A4
MLKLQRALDRLALAIEKVAGVLMGVVTLLVVVSAAGRYLFALPLPDAFDLSRLFLAAAIAWGFASVGYRGSHIKVDLVAEVLPSRARRWFDAFAWSVLLVFTVLLVWMMFARVRSAGLSGEATMDLRLPAWPFMAVIWAGFLVSIPAILARLILVVTGRGTLDQFDPAETPE